MIVELNTKIELEVKNCNLKYLTIKFLNACKGLFQQFVSEALLYYFEENYNNGKLKYILDIDNYRKKTSNATTKFKTLFGDIWVPQIQIRTVSKNGKDRQITITRTLLGVSPQYQIPDFMKELSGWISSMTTFRVGHKIIGSPIEVQVWPDKIHVLSFPGAGSSGRCQNTEYRKTYCIKGV